MQLPEMPRQTRRKLQQVKREEEIIEFRGLNRTKNCRVGELKNAVNLSTANYPCIAPRGKRIAVTQTGDHVYDNPSDIFEWDGHFVVVDQGILYYDGEAIDNVQSGKKQFAVVNTKLCIFPDKVYIDLTNSDFGHLDASVQTTGAAESVAITSSTFKASLVPLIARDLTSHTFGGNAAKFNPAVYCYGTDKASVEACYIDGAWDMEALSALESERGIMNTRNVDGRLGAGHIFIPIKAGNSFDYSWADAYHGETIDKSGYNTEGYYGVFTGASPATYSEDPSVTMVMWHFDIYKVGLSNPVFSQYFNIGDAVRISGTKDQTCDVSRAIIRSIDTSTNTLTFDLDTFDPPSGYDTSAYVVTVQREVPDLDYICEKDNRLWGVSNSQQNEVYNAETESVEIFTSRAIYASALGDPTNWWVFDGVDTDSYQVAVGGEGDFTGICSFGGGVCCWKEHRLHKVVGGFPSEYYMTDSMIEGVAAGSSRSLTVVNETLYYNGSSGVYAFSGNVPSLIGYNLGEKLFDACAGTDGKRWYLSGKTESGNDELLVYDLIHKLWMREDATYATSFAVVDGALHILTNGKIYKAEQGADSTIEWAAEFTTFTETEIIKKYYLRLVLRLDMSADSSVKAEVREDNGDWRTVHATDTTAELTKVVNMPVKRCDRFDVRISGTGNVILRAMTREYIRGSER